MAPNATPKLAHGVSEFVLTVRADDRRGYPEGKMVFSLDLSDGEVACVLVAGLDLPSRNGGCGLRTTESFDDDFVIVHRNAKDEVCGVQVLRYEPGPKSAPEFIRDVVSRNDIFLFDAVATVMRFWLPIREACAELNKKARLEREWHMTHQLESLAMLKEEVLWP